MAEAGTTRGGLVRDRFMAENAAWWLDGAGVGARMMLWAHNAHVSTRYQAMGTYLRNHYADDYVSAGFAFGAGSFNAVEQLVGGAFGALHAHTVTIQFPGSVESLFGGVPLPHFVFDARRIRLGGEAAGPLERGLTIREIGAVYSPSLGERAYRAPLVLPVDYDLLIWFATTSPSRLLVSQSSPLQLTPRGVIRATDP
jgi:erythromycin esterase-like protein